MMKILKLKLIMMIRIDIEAIKNSEKMFEDVEISSSAANGGG